MPFVSGTFRAINIGLANEVAIMCEKLGINAWEVIEAAATKPFGFMKFTPGPGLGGHCIPIDPYYLSWKLKTLDYDARFIKLAGEINTSMPKHVIDLISSSLNENEMSINGSKILIIGVAYKPDIDDCRESPAIDIIELLIQAGANVEFYDPYVKSLKLKEVNLTRVDYSAETVKSFNISVVLTNHTNVDYNILIENSSKIVDTRNVFKNEKGPNIKRLGEG